MSDGSPPPRPQLLHSFVPLPPAPIPVPAFVAAARASDVLSQHVTQEQAAEAVVACRELLVAHHDGTRRVGGFTMVAKARRSGRTDVTIQHAVAGVPKMDGLKQLQRALGGLLAEKERKTKMQTPRRKRRRAHGASSSEEEEEEEDDDDDDDDDDGDDGVEPLDPPSGRTRARTAPQPVVAAEEEEEEEIQGYATP